MNWIQHPVILESERVRLVPVDSVYFPQLIEIGKAEKIWEYTILKGWDSEKLLLNLKTMLLKRASGEQYPFVVIDKVNDRVIGCTMFHNIFPEHKKLEIGYTWYDPAYWGTGYNTDCKLLLLTYCFETLKTVRVQLQTADDNTRSRKAIQKIGAKFEGILRKERVKPDGSYRNSAMYSIIDEEWGGVKEMLELSKK